MHAIGQSPGRDAADHVLEIFEFLAQRLPAVHDEEHIAVTVVVRAPRPVGGHAVDVLFGEAAFPFGQHAGDLGHGPAHRTGVLPPRDAADMGQPADRAERPTTEIETVELDFARGVGQRETGDDRPQRRALAGPGRAHHHDVPGRRGQIQHQPVTTLVQRPVDHAGHGRQRAGPRRVRDRQAADRIGDQFAQQLVQGRRLGQRRQPHLMGRSALAGQPVGENVQQALTDRFLGVLLGFLRFGLDRGRDIRGRVLL